jgi:3-dehydrosphinganine reductase
MSVALHAIITGASSGIGLALARKLAAAGYHLSMISRRKDLLLEAATDIQRHMLREDQKIEIYPADVADIAQAEAAVKACVARLGPPDLVITSAGIAVPGYFEDMPASVFERSLAVNYLGTLYVLRAALPAMRARKRGRIVFISSGAALMGLFGYASYGPSKFAVRGLAETLRSELQADNVGVSIVYPPDTETPMLDEENKTKPEETKLITSLAKTWSADAVAECIMRGIKRGAFAITPGSTITLMHMFPGISIPLLRWYCDRIVAGVGSKSLRRREHPVHVDCLRSSS